MPESGVSTESTGKATAAISLALPSNGNGHAKPSSRHVLEFEKALCKLEQQILELEAHQTHKQIDYSKEIRQLRVNYTSLLRKTYDHLNRWETVQVARHPQRPLFNDFVEMICREFRELHGDRSFGDDAAIVCGLARLGGQKVMLIGHQKGRTLKDLIQTKF